MGKTLRKFSNKDKKTKRKRSYKKGGDKNTPTWKKAVEELEKQVDDFMKKINENKNVDELEINYNEIERYLRGAKTSCRKKKLLFDRAPLIGDTKNERCEAHKYVLYYRLHAFLVEQKDPNENITKIKKRILELLKQKMKIRVDQAFEELNNIVYDSDYKTFFHNDNIREVLTDNNNFKLLNEKKQMYLKRVIKTEENTEDVYT